MLLPCPFASLFFFRSFHETVPDLDPDPESNSYPVCYNYLSLSLSPLPLPFLTLPFLSFPLPTLPYLGLPLPYLLPIPFPPTTFIPVWAMSGFRNENVYISQSDDIVITRNAMPGLLYFGWNEDEFLRYSRPGLTLVPYP